MAADVDLYSPQLPAGPAGWSEDDYITALTEVDAAASWAKVRITGAMVTRYGEELLQAASARTGIAHSTLRSWRAVDKAFPAEKVGRPTFSVGVAEAFMALDDRLALVSRAEPWTVAGARELAASRRKPRAARPRKAGRQSAGTAHPGDQPSPDNGQQPQDTAAQGAAAGTEDGAARDGQEQPREQPRAQPPEEPQDRQDGDGTAERQDDPASAAPEMPAIPAALPEDELARLRDEVRAELRADAGLREQALEEVRAELRETAARLFEAQRAAWHEERDGLLARNGELEADRYELLRARDELEAANERLSGRMKRCPRHGVPLVPGCRACLEEAA